jgi:EAL domain-containing protein (putative c-di-GMP-specific phosphodiesterase class I)
VIAEGVEQNRDCETVVRLGVDYLQGYLLAPPLSLPELLAGDSPDVGFAAG